MKQIFAIAGALWLGCQADPESAAPSSAPFADAGSPDATGTVDPPSLGPLPQATYWPRIPVHGRGPAGGTVLVQTPAAGALTQSVGASGEFCVDVLLVAESDNMLTLRAQDQDGNLSDPVTAHVRQTGSPPPPPQPGPSQNVALGGAVAGNLFDSDGTLDLTVDGDPSTWYGGWALPPEWPLPFPVTWIWVELTERAPVASADVFSPSDCPATRYTLLASNLDAPSEPATSSSDWTTLADVTTGSGADQLMFPKALAKHVAVLFSDMGCGWVRQIHRISEIRIWTVPDAPPPAPEAPSCHGGG